MSQLTMSDLYGEAAPEANGVANGSKKQVLTGPATIHLVPQDILTGIGRISAMDFGIAVTDRGVRTYPQLVALGGGSNGSTINAFRVGWFPIRVLISSEEFQSRRSDDLTS